MFTEIYILFAYLIVGPILRFIFEQDYYWTFEGISLKRGNTKSSTRTVNQGYPEMVIVYLYLLIYLQISVLSKTKCMERSGFLIRRTKHFGFLTEYKNVKIFLFSYFDTKLLKIHTFQHFKVDCMQTSKTTV